MGLMDKVKAQATQLADKAQQAGQAGQAKLADFQAKRNADALLLELGGMSTARRWVGPPPGPTPGSPSWWPRSRPSRPSTVP